jgi:hypothetical protein
VLTIKFITDLLIDSSNTDSVAVSHQLRRDSCHRRIHGGSAAAGNNGFALPVLIAQPAHLAIRAYSSYRLLRVCALRTRSAHPLP